LHEAFSSIVHIVEDPIVFEYHLLYTATTMRLIDASTGKLHDFYLSDIPQYGILSHTWGDDEVSFLDMSSPDCSSKTYYSKIAGVRRLALENGLKYAWVDTCCIDKSSSAELTESINSMFQWYKNAVVCFVILEDLQPEAAMEDRLPGCRWFTRGWTLQELLAPKRVELYDMAWNHRGSKLDFIQIISTATRIPPPVLLGEKSLTSCSIAGRMSWAAGRETSRVEDVAYCLLGIFDVNMPLIYGEGRKAFRRLQEEIVKRSNDPTIFAWDLPQSYNQQRVGLFAASPSNFASSSSIVSFTYNGANFSVNNMGLLVSGHIPLGFGSVTGEGNQEILPYVLVLGRSSPDGLGGIYLRKIGPNVFHRDGRLPLAGFGKSRIRQIVVHELTDCYIITDPTITLDAVSSKFRNCAVHVPFDDVFRLDETVPESLWDMTDRLFLRPKPYSWFRYQMALAMSFEGTLAGEVVRLVVLCDYRENTPICRVFRRESYRLQADMLFHGRYTKKSVFWADLQVYAPEFLRLDNSVKIKAGNENFKVSITFKKGIVEKISKEVELFSLHFDITSCPDTSKRGVSRASL
jgi:heterokaryon incompatibility protein (HET)